MYTRSNVNGVRQRRRGSDVGASMERAGTETVDMYP